LDILEYYSGFNGILISEDVVVLSIP